MRSDLRILLLSPLPPPDYGGIANWTRLLRREAAGRRSLTLHVLDTSVRWRKQTDLRPWLRAAGGGIQALRDWRRAVTAMRVHRPSVVHICTSGGPAILKDLLILRSARRLGIPSIIHFRMGRIPTMPARAPQEWRMTAGAMRAATASMVLDGTSERTICELLPGVATLRVPNMVSLDEIDPLLAGVADTTVGRPRVTYVGHLLPTKGVRELVGAAAGLGNLDAELELVGPCSDPFGAELLAAGSRRPGSWMTLVGAVSHDEAIRRIARCDAFVLPSYSEGFPNVLMEAMACGRAIVATSVGAAEEMLDFGGAHECGLCVPARDEDALAEALRAVLSDPALRQTLGSHGRQRSERLYDVPRVTDMLIEVWCGLAGGLG